MGWKGKPPWESCFHTFWFLCYIVTQACDLVSESPPRKDDIAVAAVANMTNTGTNSWESRGNIDSAVKGQTVMPFSTPQTLVRQVTGVECQGQFFIWLFVSDFVLRSDVTSLKKRATTNRNTSPTSSTSATKPRATSPPLLVSVTRSKQKLLFFEVHGELNNGYLEPLLIFAVIQLSARCCSKRLGLC